MTDQYKTIKQEIKTLVDLKQIQKHLPNIYNHLQIKDYESCDDFKTLIAILEWAVNWVEKTEEFKRFTLISIINQENYLNAVETQQKQMLGVSHLADEKQDTLKRKIESDIFLLFGKRSSLHRVLSLSGYKLLGEVDSKDFYVKPDGNTFGYLQFVWVDQTQPIYTKTVFTDALVRLIDSWKTGFKKTIEIRKKEGEYTHLWSIKKLKAPKKPFWKNPTKEQIAEWQKQTKKLAPSFVIIKQRFNGTVLDYAESISFNETALTLIEPLIKQIQDLFKKQKQENNKLNDAIKHLTKNNKEEN